MAATAGQPGQVLPNPRSVQLCGYATGGALKGEPADGVLLDARTAAMIAVLLNRSPVRAPRCRQYGVEGLLRFHYTVDRDIDVAWVGGACADTTAYRGGVSFDMDRSLASMLTFLAGSYTKGGSPPVPDVIGKSSVAATSLARRSGFTVSFAGQEPDPSLPTGTVMVQGPPAGASGIGNQIDVLLSAVPAPPCTSGDLSVQYVGGGLATGFDFGTIVIRDPAPDPCTVAGPVSVRPIASAGRLLSTPRPLRPLSLERPLILSANATRTPPHATPPVGQVQVELLMQGEERDGPGVNGVCPTSDEVTPAGWQITVNHHVLTVPNDDPAGQVQHLYACLANFSTAEISAA